MTSRQLDRKPIKKLVCSTIIQSNPVNTDTEGTIESAQINELFTLSRSCY